MVTDINPFIIKFYNDIQNNELDPNNLKEFLIKNTLRLKKEGKPYYHKLRSEFNTNPSSNLLLFMNLSCFRHTLRFNSKGELTSAFGNQGLYGIKGVNLRLIYTYIKRIIFFRKLLRKCEVTFLNQDFKYLFDLINEDLGKIDIIEDRLVANPVKLKGSGVISSLTESDGIVEILPHQEGLKKGEKVIVKLFPK